MAAPVLGRRSEDRRSFLWRCEAQVLLQDFKQLLGEQTCLERMKALETLTSFVDDHSFPPEFFPDYQALTGVLCTCCCAQHMVLLCFKSTWCLC